MEQSNLEIERLLDGAMSACEFCGYCKDNPPDLDCDAYPNSRYNTSNEKFDKYLPPS